ncbi:MAG: SRPBCC family protein [Microbacteriaceae bacterium]
MTDLSITVTHTVAADIETTFNAWVTPEILTTWYAPVYGWIVGSAEVTPGVGGHYRVSFGPPPLGNDYTEEGTYTAFEPPVHLEWNGSVTDEGGENLHISVSFEARGTSTLVTVVEAGLTTTEAAEEHTEGWTAALAKLSATLQG